ncbi:site-2 protease family protein [Anaerotignum lactatifermentans]|uniref:Site-2 protease family protein n=1 Tax=Anaerotignum lactatifermentans TaxID=160404 RepID=A0ABS2G8A4_9FIRM|nr:site-2 protease family protein [Anaerotignum lactatifermentans]MBM6877709.1 site-2 protease family protein [Anaerotignum lactatifermentans]
MIVILTSIIIALIVIGMLVIAHEFGHFIVAKKSGIWVEEFAVGMGKKILSKQIGETEYTLRLFPLGGFCRMHGEMEDGEIDDRSFFAKSVPVRLAVMAAGPFMNFVLAIIMIFGISATSYIIEPEVTAIQEGYPAAQIGLQEGDVVYSINGKRIHIYDEMQNFMYQNGGTPIELGILRDGSVYLYEITPQYSEETGSYLVGFTPKVVTGLFADSVEGYEEASVLDTIEYSYFAMLNYIKVTAQGLARVFTFTASQDEYGGPISIIQVVGDSYEVGISYSVKAAIQNVVYVAAVLSANLGVLNLFPIPALDGGRILLLLIEGIRRKPLPVEMENRIQYAGFLFLMGFMVFVMYTDITKIL